VKFLSIKQAAEQWGMSSRRVQLLCSQNRVCGAQRVGNVWTIPFDAKKPEDARKKTNTAKKRINENVPIERVWAMPNKNTFEIQPIEQLIKEELTEGKWLDPFANRNKLATITNDLNKSYDTDYHLDALDFLKLFETNSIDGILYDPPYSPRQVSECYNDVGYNVTWDTTKASFWGNHKREISRLVKIGGKVITFGWNSGGIGYKYGFEIKRILIVPHGGWHNDTICTVEVKTHESNEKFQEEKQMIEDTMPALSNSPLLNGNDKELIKKLKALPIDYWDFQDDETREYTHGLHNYPAMMVCPISRNILRLIREIRPVNALLDPFAGSGTVLVEGMLSNVNTIAGNDINPLALFLSKVKTTLLDITTLQHQFTQLMSAIEKVYANNKAVIDGANEYMSSTLKLDLTGKKGWGDNAPEYLKKYCDDKAFVSDFPSFKNIGYWFKPTVILLLQVIKAEIEKVDNTGIRDFFYVAFSESIRLVSNRRNGEFKMFRMPISKVEKFEPAVINEFRKILARNIEKMNDFNEACSERNTESKVSIYNNSTTSLIDIPDNSFDLIITSPPYGDSRTTVAYGEYSRLSLQWINQSKLSDKEIMGIDRSLMGGKKYRNGFEYSLNSETLRKSLEKIKDIDIERAGDVYSFYEDLDKSISEISKKTVSGGYQFWVVGNRTVKKETLLTDVIISELSAQYSLEKIFSIDRNIPNKVMPSLNSPSNVAGEKVTTMTNEHIVVLRKR